MIERLLRLKPAGLTIAKDRANIDPDNAEDLVYLKENWEEDMAWMKKHHS